MSTLLSGATKRGFEDFGAVGKAKALVKKAPSRKLEESNKFITATDKFTWAVGPRVTEELA